MINLYISTICLENLATQSKTSSNIQNNGITSRLSIPYIVRIDLQYVRRIKYEPITVVHLGFIHSLSI